MTVEGPANTSYNVSLNIANFQIQAFNFSNDTTYEYGSGESLAFLPRLLSLGHEC